MTRNFSRTMRRWRSVRIMRCLYLLFAFGTLSYFMYGPLRAVVFAGHEKEETIRHESTAVARTNDHLWPLLRKISPPFARYCQPWPMPNVFMQNKTWIYLVPFNKLNVVTLGVNCSTLDIGLTRYRKRSLAGIIENDENKNLGQSERTNALKTITINIHSCTSYPDLYVDESYTVLAHQNGLSIAAPDVWGALRGLETLTQILCPSEDSQYIHLPETYIRDFPRYPYRGVLLDTARHFLPTELIRQNLDAMEMSKLNVFHWHVTDDESFPYKGAILELSNKGSFSKNEVYTADDIKELVEYARQRGIRIVPEFDTPGHTASWKTGSPEFMMSCSSDQPAFMNITNEALFDFLERFYTEVLELFPSSHIHLGGDEFNLKCLENELLIQNDTLLKADAHRLAKIHLGRYFQRLQSLITHLAPDRRTIVWSDLLEKSLNLPPSLTIQAWEDELFRYTSIGKIIEADFDFIYSTKWYLDHTGHGYSWRDFYTVDPMKEIGNSIPAGFVLGGEACMWGEHVDGTNLLQSIWPRASAVAERLWSSASLRNPNEAEHRFVMHRCRMLLHGIPASPDNGPGTCRKS